MTETANPTTATADAMLDAHRRRMLDMPTKIIIPMTPDRSRNSQRPARPTRRTRTL